MNRGTDTTGFAECPGRGAGEGSHQFEPGVRSFPLISNIRHFALDDGPGIRSTVFLKGCLLSCVWCHNPEAMSSGREIAFDPGLCIKCGDCQDVCDRGAITFDHEARIRREQCLTCGMCAEACSTGALRAIGKYHSPDELIEILLRDGIFYETSKGGVTFSGGEPALQADFLSGVMRELKRNGVHIAVQTSGLFDMSEFRMKLLPYIDMIYFDIKFIDREKHRKYTGKSNEVILENFVELLKMRRIVTIPRVPLVPAITATRENVSEIAAFLGEHGCSVRELLPFNSGGMEKRRMLGKEIPRELLQINNGRERTVLH